MLKLMYEVLNVLVRVDYLVVSLYNLVRWLLMSYRVMLMLHRVCFDHHQLAFVVKVAVL